MLSDTLAEAETAIHQYKSEWPELYAPFFDEIDTLRCRLVVLQMKLDQMVPDVWLVRNPIYAAAQAGNIAPYDAYMRAQDDSVLADYRREYAAFLASQTREQLP